MKLSWKQIGQVGLVAFLVYLATFYWSGINSFLGSLISAIFPILLGAFIAYVLNILMSFYERKFVKRRLVSMLLAMASILLVLIMVISIVVPQFISSLQILVQKAPDIISEIQEIPFVSSFISQETFEEMNTMNWNQMLENAEQTIMSGVIANSETIISEITSLASLVVSFVLGIIFSCYMLSKKEWLQKNSMRVVRWLFPETFVSKLLYFCRTLNECFHNFIVGQCIEAVILGFLCFLGMSLLRLPYGSMVGALIGVTALIPIAGAYIGGAIGTLILLSVSFSKAITFLIFLVILQQVEGNLIYPRVVGNMISTPGLVVLSAVTIGGSLFGVVGMLFGVPIAATLYRIVSENVRNYEKTSLSSSR